MSTWESIFQILSHIILSSSHESIIYYLDTNEVEDCDIEIERKKTQNTTKWKVSRKSCFIKNRPKNHQMKQRN